MASTGTNYRQDKSDWYGFDKINRCLPSVSGEAVRCAGAVAPIGILFVGYA